MLRSKMNTSASMPIAIDGGVEAHHAAADHQHVRGRHAGHAAEQHAAPAERLLEHERAGLGGDLARHLAHRREQRQPARASSTVS